MKTRAFFTAMLILATGGTPAFAQKNVPVLDCASLPNPVYLTGSSALQNFVKIVGKLLANDSSPSTVVYQSQGSCAGVGSIFDEAPEKQVIKDIPADGSKSANYAIFVKADGSTQECALAPEGTPVSIGISDVYASSCGYNAAPAGVSIADYFGPVQPMTFVVPSSSSQRAISAEAAYLAFGLGAAGPWSDPQLFFIRNAGSGTQQMIANAIHVPGGDWWGVDRGGSSGVRDQLKIIVDQQTASKAIGILSTDIADSERANLKVLAFQAQGQDCAYLPDSSSTARDKQNVRDGHYEIWGPSHLFARTTNGTPSTQALLFLSRFVVPQIPLELLDAEIGGSLVPQCAMHVTRTEEVGPLMSYQPPFSCDCYFDFKTKGTTDCQPCTQDQECPASTPSCNFGYCEEKGS